MPAALTFSPHLAHALLDQPTCVASVWPAFEDLRSAAHATKTSRLRLVISALVSEARLVFGACLLLARATPRPSACHHSLTGETLHGWILALPAHGPALLPTMWHSSHEQCQLLHIQLIQLVYKPLIGRPLFRHRGLRRPVRCAYSQLQARLS